jgi:predicted metal-dependent peptidase
MKNLSTLNVETQKIRLRKAKERIMGTNIYFGGFAARMRWVLSEAVPTAGTDGVTVYFNPAFLATLPDREVYGVSIHEIGHPALGHHLRRGARNPRLWNISCDIVLNLILMEDGIHLPKGGIIRPEFKGWKAEDVYNKLMKDGEHQDGDEGQPGDGKPGEAGEGGTGPVWKSDDLRDDPRLSPGNGDEDEDGEPGNGDADGPQEYPVDDGEHQVGKDERTMDPEAEWRELSETLEAMAKKAGQWSNGNLAAAVDSAQKPKVNWADYLSTLLETVISNDDKSWNRIDRRRSGGRFLFPGDFSEEYGDIVIAVDTSGSMWSGDMRAKMAAEMSAILRAKPFQRCVVIYADWEVQNTEEINPHYEELSFDFRGGGGTSFAGPFKWLQERAEEYDPAAVIYLTDMCGSYGTADMIPDCPVFWVNYGYSGDEVDEAWKDVSEVIYCDPSE